MGQMMIAENEDLLIEILLRLPAKSLIRFKLVCKRWFSIIASHCFYNRHILLYRHHICHFAPKPSFLICLSESFNYFYIQLSPHGAKLVPCHFFPTLVKPIICGSSNGLFLIQCDVVANPMGDCYIYNPTSKESRKISLNTNDNHTSVLGLNLAFDPLKSPHYKIICIRGSGPDVLGRRWWYQCQTEVYESDTGVWELCGEPFMVPSYTFFSKGIYWNRSIHWRGVFFDFHGNHLRYHPEVVASADTRRTKVSSNYVESNGCLHYAAHVHKEKSVMVFELQSDYSEWSLMYRINLDMIPAPLSMLSMIRGENEEGDALLLQVPGKIMAYRFTNKSMKEIVNFGHEAFYKEPCNHFFPQLETFQYIETLAPP